MKKVLQKKVFLGPHILITDLPLKVLYLLRQTSFFIWFRQRLYMTSSKTAVPNDGLFGSYFNQ
jgi:hypothetical protein